MNTIHEEHLALLPRTFSVTVFLIIILDIHPVKLTWNPKSKVLNMFFPFQLGEV